MNCDCCGKDLGFHAICQFCGEVAITNSSFKSSKSIYNRACEINDEYLSKNISKESATVELFWLLEGSDVSVNDIWILVELRIALSDFKKAILKHKKNTDKGAE